ncbi:MAG: TonB-dependent receptor domain-containing protein [Woeseiaceae bacterium]
MSTVFEYSRSTVALAVTMVLSSWHIAAQAQDQEPAREEAAPGPQQGVEEVVVTGRFLTSSQRLVNERLNDASVTDMLGAETIGRLGDSTVASALRRIPGLSLVADKYVYIRGLGERYSASSLNGAQIPSPDLTRNVIPLDVFPTSIVESLRVQKAWSADLPANFGGGNIDIRTKGIPDDFTLSFEFGSGFNSESSSTMLSYPGSSDDDFGTDDGARALSGDLLDAINEFQGNTDVQGILTFLRRQDPTATLADAQAINRQLGLELNRQIGLEQKDVLPDIKARASVGNNFLLSDNWEFGFLVGAAYETDWRETRALRRSFSFPDERTDTETESTHAINVAGTLNLGLKYTEDHAVSTTTLLLRNTDDETAIRDFFNENREISDGIGFRDYRLQFEERNMVTNQVKGTHYLGEATRDRLPFLDGLVGWLPLETGFDWFYSESEAETDIPNQVTISAQTITDDVTAEVLGSAVALSSQAADYRFTDLDDEVINHGWAVTLPFNTDRAVFELTAGYDHSRKARTYRQSQFSLGALNVADPSVLQGTLDEVFSDDNILDPTNNFVFDIQGTNNQSYIAATMTDGIFGQVDWTLNDTWRVAAGARWEDYRQVALDWNPFGYSATNPQVTTDPEILEEGTFQDDQIYPAASFTYMGDWWAETFQLRFGWSRTTVRPDLREITDASYIDPITDELVRGNPGVVPADVTNYDVRAEWFFGNGDSLSTTLFRKELGNPIEFFESAASDTSTAREIINAESAEVQGIELEGLKNLGFLGSVFEPLFVQGNVTVQESELVAGPDADVPTNPVRDLSGASEYVANVMLGFDAPNNRHTASLIYNVFGERLYVAGRNGAPDGYEQPFHSLDFTWSWYPTDTMTLKLKTRNLLGETVTIERAGVITFEEDPGTSYSLSFQWAL